MNDLHDDDVTPLCDSHHMTCVCDAVEEEDTDPLPPLLLTMTIQGASTEAAEGGRAIKRNFKKMAWQCTTIYIAIHDNS